MDAAISPDLGKHLPHRGNRGADRMIAVDHHADVAELANPGLGQIRIGRGDHHQPGLAVPSPRKGDDLARCLLLGVDEDHIGPGLGVGMGSLQRLLEPEIGDQGFRACDHQQVTFALCGAGRSDLALKFLNPDEVLPAAGEEARILGNSLVLDNYRGDPARE